MSQSKGKSTEVSRNSLSCIRLLIADDQPRARQSLKALLTALRWSTPNRTELLIEIVGEADDGQHAVEQVQALCPDVVVLDFPNHDRAKRTITCRVEAGWLGHNSDDQAPLAHGQDCGADHVCHRSFSRPVGRRRCLPAQGLRHQ